MTQQRKKKKRRTKSRSSSPLKDAKGRPRAPGTDPKTGEYSTAQMLRDEMSGGDPGQPLFD